MNFNTQSKILSELTKCASADKHSILIEGVSGSGKTYVAKQYADMLNIDTIVSVDPKVSEIRDTIDNCYRYAEKIVVIIENLDGGVLRSSFTMLKFLEEPPDNVYIVITCRSTASLPDTIVSRSVCLYLSPPTAIEILQYAEHRDLNSYNMLKTTNVWKCASNYQLVDKFLAMPAEQIAYYNSIPDMFPFSDTISNVVWKISHFEDNSETDLNIVCLIIMNCVKDTRIRKHCIAFANDLASGYLSKHAVISKFILECKYGE